MQNVFWLIPGKLAGRTGPNVDPWNPVELKRSGVDAVLSVNSGILVDAAALEACGLTYACIPFSWNAPPAPGDIEICLEALPRAFAFVQRNIEARKAVMIHCSSGKDRTGLLMSYYLMRTKGLTVDEAILEVRRVRPIALSALGWEPFAREVLRRGLPTSE
jgi:protein-tyrosine phosphatase